MTETVATVTPVWKNYSDITASALAATYSIAGTYFTNSTAKIIQYIDTESYNYKPISTIEKNYIRYEYTRPISEFSEFYTYDMARHFDARREVYTNNLHPCREIYTNSLHPNDWDLGWETIGCGSGVVFGSGWPVRSPGDRLREVIRSRQTPAVVGSRQALRASSDVRETRARETLRRVIGEQRFRNFLKHGFFTVRAKSGIVYQIHPGHKMTCAWKDGQLIEQLCVVLQGNFPPTDEAIMRFLLIMNNEEMFRSKANISHVPKNIGSSVGVDRQPSARSLVDIFGEMKMGVTRKVA